MNFNTSRYGKIFKRLAILAWESPYKDNLNMQSSMVSYGRIALFLVGVISASQCISAFSDPLGYIKMFKRAFVDGQASHDEGLNITLSIIVRQIASLLLVLSVICFRSLRGKLEDIVSGLAMCLTYFVMNTLSLGFAYLNVENPAASNEFILNVVILCVLGYICSFPFLYLIL